jgi:hypothetical protein
MLVVSTLGCRLAAQVVGASVELLIHSLLWRHNTLRPSLTLGGVECLPIASNAGTSGRVDSLPIPCPFSTLGGVDGIAVPPSVGTLGGVMGNGIPQSVSLCESARDAALIRDIALTAVAVAAWLDRFAYPRHTELVN